jgi:hypothetical protein
MKILMISGTPPTSDEDAFDLVLRKPLELTELLAAVATLLTPDAFTDDNSGLEEI